MSPWLLCLRISFSVDRCYSSKASRSWIAHAIQVGAVEGPKVRFASSVDARCHNGRGKDMRENPEPNQVLREPAVDPAQCTGHAVFVQCERFPGSRLSANVGSANVGAMWHLQIDPGKMVCS